MLNSLLRILGTQIRIPTPEMCGSVSAGSSQQGSQVEKEESVTREQ